MNSVIFFFTKLFLCTCSGIMKFLVTHLDVLLRGSVFLSFHSVLHVSKLTSCAQGPAV